MAIINQIEVRRGNANGGIDTNVYDLAAGAGVSAYGEIDSVVLDPENNNQLLLTAKLSPEFDNFIFSQNQLVCLRILNSVVIPTIDDSHCMLKLCIKDSTGATTIEEKHTLVKRWVSSPSGTTMRIGSIAPSMTILVLCQQSDPNNKYYH